MIVFGEVSSTTFESFSRDKGICKECGEKCTQNEFHADHIIPHSKGGETKLSNGQLLCPTCNLKKSSSLEKFIPK